MYGVRRSFQAVVVLFAVTFFGSPAFSQSARFFSVEARPMGVPGPASSADPCSVNENRSIAARAGDRNGSASCSHSLAKALEILETENACTDWYRTRNSDPAAVFRTVTFAVDRKGEAFVRKAPAGDGFEMIYNPYVASVEQDGGPSSTVTINANGAFFFPAASLVEDRFKGGPLSFQGTRWIQVGPYVGGSFRAQVLVLLHEFGHVIDLLPEDREDRDGKSRQNTLDVLRACRAEVESKEAPHTFFSSR